MDHVGLIARDIQTIGQAFEVLEPAHRTDHMPEARTLRIGWPHVWIARAEPMVIEAARVAVAAAGAEIVPIDLPLTACHSALVNYAVLAGEAAQALEQPIRSDAHTDPRILPIVAAGARLSREEVHLAHRTRVAIAQEQLAALKKVDLIATPTVAIGPLLLESSPSGGYSASHERGWPAVADYFTAAANSTGFPAISIPAPSADGQSLIGFQLIAGPHEDRWLLRIAAQLFADGCN